MYYVESDNYMPVRGKEWYYHDMICYCLDMDIIKLENIKYAVKSSLLIPNCCYNKFIDCCYKNIGIKVNSRFIQRVETSNQI